MSESVVGVGWPMMALRGRALATRCAGGVGGDAMGLEGQEHPDVAAGEFCVVPATGTPCGSAA